jgi:DNA-binding transcriptional ArsR family regulator
MPFMIIRRDVFQAIADPTRRDIIRTVSDRALTLNEVAESFKISRQAVSKHVKILTECGLIVIRQEGRERYCQASLVHLKEVSEWAGQYKQHWEQRLDSLENYLEQIQTKSIKHGKSKR